MASPPPTTSDSPTPFRRASACSPMAACGPSPSATSPSTFRSPRPAASTGRAVPPCASCSAPLAARNASVRRRKPPQAPCLHPQGPRSWTGHSGLLAQRPVGAAGVDAGVVADLVLWIDYLQWHFRTRGDAQPPIPVIRNFHNIVESDTLLSWKKKLTVEDREGVVVTQCDGITKKEHPTTGQQVPDETARRPVYEYTDVKQANWPEADFIVGNPSLIGGKDIRSELGDGYVAALHRVYDSVPESVDFVMYWWQRAAELARASKIRRFGFITTNSLPQVFNRKVVTQNLNATQDPLSLIFAIPDHPWLNSLSTETRSAAKHAAVTSRLATVLSHRHGGKRSGSGGDPHQHHRAEAVFCPGPVQSGVRR